MNLPILFEIFKSLRPAFGRFQIFLYFFLYTLGVMSFPVTSITDILRCLRLEPEKYTAFAQFLESKSINLKCLSELWQKCVYRYLEKDCLKIQGRKVLALDSTLIKKYGKKIPETSKQFDSNHSIFFEGYKWELIGLIVKKSWVSLCVPVSYFLHKPKIKKPVEEKKESQIDDINSWLHSLIWTTNSILVADSWYACQKIYFALADLNISFVTRIGKNAVAYDSVEPETQKRRGRKRKYGEKIVFKDEFMKKEGFEKYEIEGQVLEAKKLYLLWKSVKEKVVFILVKLPDGKNFILLSNDSSLTTENIIRCYKSRCGIERSFRSLKQDFALSCCKKWYKKSSNLMKKRTAHRVHFMACMIAMGINQILAMTCSKTIWSDLNLWLRTVDKNLPPSEAVVKNYVQIQILGFLSKQQNGLALWKKKLQQQTESQNTWYHWHNNKTESYG